MKASGKIAAVILLLAVCGTVGCGRKPEKILRADSKDLKHTIITAHLEEKIVPGKNLIYCSTFQLAWNELRDKIHKEDIRLADEPPMVKILNKKLFSKDDLSEDCYLAMAGFRRQGIVDEINEALKTKFGEEAPTVAGKDVGRAVIVAYAFLFKNLKFETPFMTCRKPLVFRSASRRSKVRAFGTEDAWPPKHVPSEFRRQVEILDYDYATGDFAIGLTTESPNDEIVLAVIQPAGTILETVQSVQKKIQGERPEFMGVMDILQIPKLDFDITHSYSQLLGKFLLNEGFTEMFIGTARQDIRFRLNEKGAMLESEATITEVSDSRRLVFDRPFLLYLKEKQAKYPYLAIWVDNPEILMTW